MRSYRTTKLQITLDEEDFRVLVSGEAVTRPRGSDLFEGLQIILADIGIEAMVDAIARAQHKLNPWPGGCGPECAQDLRGYVTGGDMYYLCFTHERPGLRGPGDPLTHPTEWTAATREAALAGQVPEYKGRAAS